MVDKILGHVFDTEDIPVSVIDNLIEHLNVVIEEAAG